MKIDLNYIKTFNPCTSGWENLIEHYPKYEGTMQEFLTLENIPYEDRIWLAQKVVPLKILRQWAVECVEGGLHIYEGEYPGDFRVRDCIEAFKDYLEGKCSREALLEKQRALPWYGRAVDSVLDSDLLAVVVVEAEMDSVLDSVAAAEMAVAALDLEAAAALAVRRATNAIVLAKVNSIEDQRNIHLSILIELINNREA